MHRILLSGGSGFLGSWTASSLVAQGYEVALLGRTSTNWWRTQGLNVSRFASPTDAFANFKPDVVVSLDWSGVENANRNDPEQIENVSRIKALAELSIRYGARAFIGVGSQAEYGPKSKVIDEEDECRPTTIYGEAKLAAYHELDKLFSESSVRFSWVRIFSTYGALDTGNWLIRNVLLAMSKNEKIPLTMGEQNWSYLHAADAARAFTKLVENEVPTGVYNLGHPDSPTLRETLLKIKRITNSESELSFGEVPYREDQVMLLAPRMTRLLEIGWSPQVTFEEGILHTSDWINGITVNDMFNQGRYLPSRT